MKRLCVISIAEKADPNAGYLAKMLEAWEKAEVEVCLISDRKDFDEDYSKPVKENLYEAIQYARENFCDEIILMTDELMGPVWPLDDLLHRADTVENDVWYLARGASMWGVCRTKWGRIADIGSVKEAGAFLLNTNEAKELYDTWDLSDVTSVPMLDEPLMMVRDRKCPFFMHAVFYREYADVLQTTLGHQGQAFYRWLLRESDWDTNLLWDYLLENQHQYDYYRAMHLNYILPTKTSRPDWVKSHLEDHSVALVMHLYYPDKLEESCSFARQFPQQSHVIITTSSKEKKQRILDVFCHEHFASLDVRVIENRGRDVSALLVGAAEVFDTYDYVCFFHDKKTLQTKPGSIGAGFAYKLEENLFATGDFVNNVIRLFADNPRLGMLSPTPPHHGDYFPTLGRKWVPNYPKAEKLAKELDFTVPMSPDKAPVAPLGTCFWFRGKALKPLSDHHWRYSEFPPEPNGIDGTILHAIERLYSIACAQAGYYPAYLLSDRYAAIEYNSLRHYVRNFNKLLIDNGMLGYHRDMCAELRRRLGGK